MNTSVLLRAIVGAVTYVLLSSTAMAQATVKVGVIAEFSGPFAAYGQQIEAGMKAYMKQHGDTVAGARSSSSPATPEARRRTWPSASRRSWSRATRSQFLAGFGLTPNAMAVAPVATEAKVPMIIIERGDVGDHHPLAVHRARVDDDAAGERADGGVGAEERDQAGVHGGGRLRSRHRRRDAVHEERSRPAAARSSGRLRTPLQNPDFSAPIQRVKDAKPAGGVRVPAGGRAGHRVREGVQRARTGEGGHQADRAPATSPTTTCSTRWATRRSG